MAFPREKGLSAPPGFATSIGMRKVMLQFDFLVFSLYAVSVGKLACDVQLGSKTKQFLKLTAQ